MWVDGVDGYEMDLLPTHTFVVSTKTNVKLDCEYYMSQTGQFLRLVRVYTTQGHKLLLISWTIGGTPDDLYLVSFYTRCREKVLIQLLNGLLRIVKILFWVKRWTSEQTPGSNFFNFQSMTSWGGGTKCLRQRYTMLVLVLRSLKSCSFELKQVSH